MKLDKELYQMIPKPIADQLRGGEPPVNTWREAGSVSVLFAQVVNFTSVAPEDMMDVAGVFFATCSTLCEIHLVHEVGEDWWVNHAHSITVLCWHIFLLCTSLSTNKPLPTI